jgi:hypothetical protein
MTDVVGKKPGFFRRMANGIKGMSLLQKVCAVGGLVAGVVAIVCSCGLLTAPVVAVVGTVAAVVAGSTSVVSSIANFVEICRSGRWKELSAFQKVVAVSKMGFGVLIGALSIASPFLSQILLEAANVGAEAVNIGTEVANIGAETVNVAITATNARIASETSTLVKVANAAKVARTIRIANLAREAVSAATILSSSMTGLQIINTPPPRERSLVDTVISDASSEAVRIAIDGVKSSIVANNLDVRIATSEHPTGVNPGVGAIVDERRNGTTDTATTTHTSQSSVDVKKALVGATDFDTGNINREDTNAAASKSIASHIAATGFLQRTEGVVVSRKNNLHSAAKKPIPSHVVEAMDYLQQINEGTSQQKNNLPEVAKKRISVVERMLSWFKPKLEKTKEQKKSGFSLSR